MRNSVLLTIVACVATRGLAQIPTPDISPDRLMGHIKVLSSDAFEGRGPGTPGEDKTIAYLVDQYKQMGLAPGNPDGSYIQKVPLVGITSKTTTSFVTPSGTLTPSWINDYVAVSHRVTPKVEVKDSDIVFCGYGVVAPEYGWDDFKGVDVHGKTIVVLINDPPVPDPANPHKLDETMFKGKAMTYYGRWTYKYDEASVKGAAAVLIIHETGPAGYPFAVIAVSQGRENFEIKSADGNASHVGVEGWLTLDGAKKLLTACGKDFDTLKAAAVSKDFHPVSLGAKANFAVENSIRDVASRNVIAMVPGSDPKLKDEYVIYSAHWDHLGRDDRLKGDQIFNGASDNASGTAVLLELAHAYSVLPAAERQKRSVLFLSVTAEEKGLLGSRYYATNPLYPLTKTVANINMDGAQTIGPSRDIEVLGYGNSTMDDIARDLLAKDHRVLVPDTEPEKGYFYRSDHFEFAKQGVPAFYTHAGIDIIGQPAGYGLEKRAEYVANDYHKVSDEIKPWWDLRGAAQDGALLFSIGYVVATTDTWPTWKPGCEFKAKRDHDLAAAK